MRRMSGCSGGVRRDGEDSWRFSVAGDGRTASPLALLPRAIAAATHARDPRCHRALGREGRARDLAPDSWRGDLGTSTAARYLAPLCPAGHLPHKGGDQQLHARHNFTAPNLLRVQHWRRREMTANLPPCGGDVRQDRGGRKEREFPSLLGIFALQHANTPSPSPCPSAACRPKPLSRSHEQPPARRLRNPLRPAPHFAGPRPFRTRLRENSGAPPSLGFVTDPADPRKIAACPGAPACASGHIATRKIAEEIAKEAGDILDLLLPPRFGLRQGLRPSCRSITDAGRRRKRSRTCRFGNGTGPSGGLHAGL